MFYAHSVCWMVCKTPLDGHRRMMKQMKGKVRLSIGSGDLYRYVFTLENGDTFTDGEIDKELLGYELSFDNEFNLKYIDAYIEGQSVCEWFDDCDEIASEMTARVAVNPEMDLQIDTYSCGSIVQKGEPIKEPVIGVYEFSNSRGSFELIEARFKHLPGMTEMTDVADYLETVIKDAWKLMRE
jgi:hypothetical protein